jgi:hypothetical protein
MQMARSSDLLEAALPDCRASEFYYEMAWRASSLRIATEVLAAGVVVGSDDIAFE